MCEEGHGGHIRGVTEWPTEAKCFRHINEMFIGVESYLDHLPCPGESDEISMAILSMHAIASTNLVQRDDRAEERLQIH